MRRHLSALASVPRFALAAILPAALSGAVAAQAQFSTGPLAFTPGAFSYKDNGFAGATIHAKRPGFKTGTGPFAAPPGRPDYDKATEFASLPGDCRPTGPLDIDAMSVGLDWVMAQPNGEVNVMDSRWGAIAFSVRKGSRGLPDTTIRAESDRHSDVFSYFPEPIDMDPDPQARLAGTTAKALDRAEIDPDLPRRVDIDAVDIPMQTYRLDDQVYAAVLAWKAGEPARFYFSVSRRTAEHLPAGWMPPGMQRSGATVFVREWSAMTNSWSCPEVFLAWTDFTSSSQPIESTFDLVALAVDEKHDIVLFSMLDKRRKTWINPLMVLPTLAESAGSAVYGGDEPVSVKVGLLDTDTVDGVCSLDPTHAGPTPFDRSPIAFAMGTPIDLKFGPALFPNPGSANGSAFLDYIGDQIQLKTYASGWQPSGPGNGFSVLQVCDPVCAEFINPRVRIPSCPGSPVEMVFNLPVLDPMTPYTLHWLLAGVLTPPDISEALPIAMMSPY